MPIVLFLFVQILTTLKWN